MAKADEQIRVSSEIKERLEGLKREGESFNDVLERVLGGEKDVLAGAGMLDERQAGAIRETVEKRKSDSWARKQ